MLRSCYGVLNPAQWLPILGGGLNNGARASLGHPLDLPDLVHTAHFALNSGTRGNTSNSAYATCCIRCGGWRPAPGADEETCMAIPEELRRIVEMEINPQEIIDLVEEMTKKRNDGIETNWYTTVGLLADRYHDEYDRAFCIHERMQCLNNMMEDARMSAWTTRTNDLSFLYVNAAAFIAAAKCPLRFRDELYFDPEEFFRMALEESTPDARA